MQDWARWSQWVGVYGYIRKEPMTPQEIANWRRQKDLHQALARLKYDPTLTPKGQEALINQLHKNMDEWDRWLDKVEASEKTKSIWRKALELIAGEVRAGREIPLVQPAIELLRPLLGKEPEEAKD